MSRDQIIKEIKQRILEIIPEASIWLYGSQARGDYGQNSDWDILIVTDQKLSFEQKDKIFDSITRLSIQTDQLITLTFNTREQIENFKYDMFYQNVLNEKIVL